MQAWESLLARWVTAGLVDTDQAGRIRAFEADQARGAGLRWPVLVAIAFGAILLAAGLLLFIAAHWESLSPWQRFALVLAVLCALHVAAALVAGRFAVLSTALHAVGTVALGAGIFLSGQIFHLEVHWPSGILLWALGAAAGWLVLRDWPQLALAAVLVPAWLGSEWVVAADGSQAWEWPLFDFLLLLSITYLSASHPGRQDGNHRAALRWIGGMALLPCAIFAVMARVGYATGAPTLPQGERVAAFAVAYGLPLALAVALRGRRAWMNAVAAFWVILVGTIDSYSYGPRPGPNATLAHAATGIAWNELARYGLCAIGSIGLVAWGLREARRERVNLGIAGFAITVTVFYFSEVMDKLGRSASLIGLGLLFLLGGWGLERLRRRLVAQLAGRGKVGT
jgi:uncharacterized membrane protein